MPTDFDAGLLDTGIPSASFLKVGTSYSGIVVAVAEEQSRDYDTKDLEWWDDEKTRPKMQHVITIMQEKPGADNEQRVRLFLKPGARRAISAAIKESGATTSRHGYLTLAYTGDEKPKRKGVSGEKIWSAKFVPPGADGYPEWAPSADEIPF